MHNDRILSIGSVIASLLQRIPKVELLNALDLKMDARYANDVRAVAAAMILNAAS